MDKILKTILLVILLGSLLLQAQAAEEETGINNETLTGGVIQEDGYYLPTGMKIPVVLRTPIDTRVNRVRDQITVQTTEDLLIGDYVLVPANSFLHGYISRLEKPGRWQKTPKVSIDFDTVSLKGKSGGRRFVSLKGSIKERQILKSSERVNNGALYKSKVKKAGAVGGVAGGVTGWAVTELINPFGSWGMVGLANQLLIGGSAVGGVVLASSLISKDDIRIEPGAELEVILDRPTYDNFEKIHPLSHNNIKDLAPEEAYDKFGTLEAKPLENMSKASPEEEKEFNKTASLI